MDTHLTELPSGEILKALHTNSGMLYFSNCTGRKYLAFRDMQILTYVIDVYARDGSLIWSSATDDIYDLTSTMFLIAPLQDWTIQ